MKKKRRANAAKRMVLRPVYRPRIEKAKKGKGSYTRKEKHCDE